jgi:hypothetical protein
MQRQNTIFLLYHHSSGKKLLSQDLQLWYYSEQRIKRAGSRAQPLRPAAPHLRVIDNYGKGLFMKIAATYENGSIFQHFGRTESFKVYEVEDGKIVSSEVIGSNGIGHGALAGLLAQQDIQVLICGGLGGVSDPVRADHFT